MVHLTGLLLWNYSRLGQECQKRTCEEKMTGTGIYRLDALGFTQRTVSEHPNRTQCNDFNRKISLTGLNLSCPINGLMMGRDVAPFKPL